MLSTYEAPLALVHSDPQPSDAVALARAQAALAALKQAAGDQYKSPEIVSFPITAHTVVDVMAVTGNF